MSRTSYDSRIYRKVLLAIQVDGPACVLCGHAGSDSIHHRIPTSIMPELASDPANWAPAHGVRGCPVCKRRCNQEQGNKLGPLAPARPTQPRW